MMRDAPDHMRRMGRAVGAVIVTHANPEMAGRCALSILGDLAKEDIVAVVNLPSRCDIADLQALERTVGTVVRNPRPQGYGANLNAGVREVGDGHELLLLLNDDAFPEPGAVRELAATMTAHPHAGLVGPRIVDAEGVPQPCAFRFPSLASELAYLVMLPDAWVAPFRERFGLASSSRSGNAVDWVLGAALLARAAAFRQIGGFDETYFLYCEETDLAHRLCAGGWTTHLCTDAVVHHLGASSTSGTLRQLLGRSRGRYLRRHWPLPKRLALSTLTPLVMAWNALYVAVRIAADPRSTRSKCRLWLAHWRSRALAPSRPSRG